MDELIDRVLRKAESFEDMSYDIPVTSKKKTPNSIKYNWMGKIHDISSLDVSSKKFINEEDLEDDELNTQDFNKYVNELKNISKQLKEISIELAGEYSGIADSIDDTSKTIADLGKKLEEQL